jgi:hypothetical protein
MTTEIPPHLNVISATFAAMLFISFYIVARAAATLSAEAELIATSSTMKAMPRLTARFFARHLLHPLNRLNIPL